jgi:hypothetical protein
VTGLHILAFGYLWALAIYEIRVGNLIASPGRQQRSRKSAGRRSSWVIALMVLLIIILMLAAFAYRHRRCLRRIRELGIDDIYKNVDHIFDRIWEARIILIIPVIPVLLILILGSNIPLTQEIVVMFLIILGPIVMGMYFLGRAHQRFVMLTDIKSWEAKLRALKSAAQIVLD